MYKMSRQRLLFLFLFASVVAFDVVAGKDKCIPGKTFKQDCNTCICSKDGKSSACTLMECPQESKESKEPKESEESKESEEVEITTPKRVCEPDTSFPNDCNTCFCDSDGLSYSCTRQSCVSAPRYELHIRKRAATQDRKQVCKPGSKFKQGCNGCICSSDGTTAMCTQMACPTSFYNLRAKRGEIDGQSKRCAGMACDKSIYNEDGSQRAKRQASSDSATTTPANKVCEPGALTSLDGICNFCICNKEGTQSACTKNHCSSSLIKTFEEEEKWGPLYKQGDNCLPGKGFYSECNQCVCRPDARSAYCTLTSCVT